MYDVDNETSGTFSEKGRYSFCGIPKIKIPKTDADFYGGDWGFSVLKKYMPSILAKHREYADKIKYFRNYRFGLQDILNKQRLYQSDSANNNQIIENHASRQVDFKVGFATGEHREYTAKTELKDDEEIKSELTTLAKYFSDCNFFGKDKELKDWIYNVGVGVTYCSPRTDIIRKIGDDDYAIDENFDIENEAPFEFDVLSPIDNFVVYSSSRGEKPLFCVSIVEVEKDATSETIKLQKEIHVETRYASFILNTNLAYKGATNYRRETLKSTPYFPMVEHCADSSRIGVVEKNRDIFNLLNLLVSNTTDMVVDKSNIIYVFEGTDIDGDSLQEMIKAGAIVLPPSQNGTNQQAHLNTLKIEIPFDGLDAFYEQRLSQAYDIAGVPLASGQVTSGGDTGQARLLGGGWNNAYTIVKNDINSFVESDNAVLKLILGICKLYPSCPINKIKSGQIDIKYRINQSDNFLVKAQGIAQLYTTNMPKELILKYSGISSDIGTESTAWEEHDKAVKEAANSITTVQPTADGGIAAQDHKSNDNGSQE